MESGTQDLAHRGFTLFRRGVGVGRGERRGSSGQWSMEPGPKSIRVNPPRYRCPEAEGAPQPVLSRAFRLDVAPKLPAYHAHVLLNLTGPI